MSGPTEGPYHRDDRTVYALQESGDCRCPMINRWSAHVQSAPGTPDDELEAVAVLFEAAPDLLDALENLIIAIGMGWDLDGVVEQGQAAIVKARKP